MWKSTRPEPLTFAGQKEYQGSAPYFDTVDIKITIYTQESEERMQKLARNAESRCPVMNLFRDAGSEFNAEWVIK